MKRENFSAFCWTLAFALQSSNFFHRPVYCVNNTFYKIPYILLDSSLTGLALDWHWTDTGLNNHTGHTLDTHWTHWTH